MSYNAHPRLRIPNMSSESYDRKSDDDIKVIEVGVVSGPKASALTGYMLNQDVTNEKTFEPKTIEFQSGTPVTWAPS